MRQSDVLESTAELFDWLAFATILGVVWLVYDRWGVALSVLAGMAYGGAVVLGVGYLRTRLRMHTARKAGAQSAISKPPSLETSDEATVKPSDDATVRLLIWCAIVMTFIFGAGYLLDATNGGVLRSSYVVLGSILAMLWGCIGLYHLLFGRLSRKASNRPQR